MPGIKKTISVLGICLIFLCALPAAALTVDDYVSSERQLESSHLEEVVETAVSADTLKEGAVVCTTSGEECFIKHTESGESAVLEYTGVVPTKYTEGSELVLPAPEDNTSAVVSEIPAQSDNTSAVVDEPAPVQVIKQIVYLPTPEVELPAEETTEPTEPAEVVELSPEVIDTALNLAVQIPTETLGLADFGLSNIFNGSNAKNKGGDSIWVIYWSLIAVFSYGITLFTFRAALVERGQAEAKNVRSVRKNPRLRISR